MFKYVLNVGDRVLIRRGSRIREGVVIDGLKHCIKVRFTFLWFSWSRWFSLQATAYEIVFKAQDTQFVDASDA